MAGYTLSALEADLRSYTEVDSTVFSGALLGRFIENAEYRLMRDCPIDADRKQQLEKEFISRFKLAPGFARQVEIREGQRARPGDRIIYKRGIGIKRKVARQAIKPIRLKEDYQFTAYKKTKPKTPKGFAKRTKKLTP